MEASPNFIDYRGGGGVRLGCFHADLTSLLTRLLYAASNLVWLYPILSTFPVMPRFVASINHHQPANTVRGSWHLGLDLLKHYKALHNNQVVKAMMNNEF